MNEKREREKDQKYLWFHAFYQNTFAGRSVSFEALTTVASVIQESIDTNSQFGVTIVTTRAKVSSAGLATFFPVSRLLL